MFNSINFSCLCPCQDRAIWVQRTAFVLAVALAILALTSIGHQQRWWSAPAMTQFDIKIWIGLGGVGGAILIGMVLYQVVSKRGVKAHPAVPAQAILNRHQGSHQPNQATLQPIIRLMADAVEAKLNPGEYTTWSCKGGKEILVFGKSGRGEFVQGLWNQTVELSTFLGAMLDRDTRANENAFTKEITCDPDWFQEIFCGLGKNSAGQSLGQFWILDQLIPQSYTILETTKNAAPYYVAYYKHEQGTVRLEAADLKDIMLSIHIQGEWQPLYVPILIPQTNKKNITCLQEVPCMTPFTQKSLEKAYKELTHSNTYTIEEKERVYCLYWFKLEPTSGGPRLYQKWIPKDQNIKYYRQDPNGGGNTECTCLPTLETIQEMEKLDAAGRSEEPAFYIPWDS